MVVDSTVLGRLEATVVDPYILITNPDPGEPITYGSNWIRMQAFS